MIKKYSIIKIFGTFSFENTNCRISFESKPEQNIETGDKPFKIISKNISIISKSNNYLFPLDLSLTLPDSKKIKICIDNNKQPFLINSNGCSTCSDGIGIKNYIYPLLTGDGIKGDKDILFKGCWEHAWESGIHPIGYTRSICLRGLMNIEKKLNHVFYLDNWMEIFIFLDNNYILFGKITPLPTTRHYQQFNVFKVINSHGKIQKELVYMRPDIIKNKFIYKFNILGSTFELDILLYENPVQNLIHTDGDAKIDYINSAANVRGYIENHKVYGHAYVEMTPQLTYRQKSKQVLKLLGMNDNWMGNYQVSNVPDDEEFLKSVMFFLIPILFILFLICMIFFHIKENKKRIKNSIIYINKNEL